MMTTDYSSTSRLILVGSTGNTGAHVLNLLCQAQPQREMIALVRAESNTSSLEKLGIPYIVCNLEEPESYIPYIRPGDTLLEMANLRHAHRMMPHLIKAGVSRAFCVTTTAVFSRHHSFSKSYLEIEAELKNADWHATILRPSMIYGNERDHNMHKLLRVLNRTMIFPVFGEGQALMQPVHVEDLAYGIARAVVMDARGEYNLAGPEPLTYCDVINQACVALGKRVWLLFIPTAPAAALAGFLEGIPRFPIKREQVLRLQEDKTFDISTSCQSLGYQPRPFAVGIAQEVVRLRRAELL